MAMSKKERDQYQQALTMLALRHTSPLPPSLNATDDVPFVKGYHATFNASSVVAKVTEACSTKFDHSTRLSDRTTSHHPLTLHHSKLDALQDIRYRMEQEFARQLYEIDQQIEAERAAGQQA